MVLGKNRMVNVGKHLLLVQSAHFSVDLKHITLLKIQLV